MVYEEGDIGEMIVRDEKKKLCECPVDTQLVQLKSIRPVPEIKISESDDVVRAIKDMENFDREHMRILHLDTKNRIIGIETVSIGILDPALIHPREVLKGALLDNASGIIMVHNHPSGLCEQSQEDKDVAKLLQDACDLIGIKFLDSIVIGKECYSSKECPQCAMPSGEQHA